MFRVGGWAVRVAAVGALSFPCRAVASGFDAVQVASAQSSPVAADAAAVHFNPGMLGYLERPEIVVGGGLIVGAVSYERVRYGAYQYEDNFDVAEPISPEDLDPSKTGRAGRVSDVPVGPNLDLFFAAPVVRDRLVLGMGIYIPYAAVLDLPDDGPQRFQLLHITLASLHVTASAAVKLHDVVSIGAGFTWAPTLLELAKVQDFAAVDLFGEVLERPPVGQPNDFGSDAPASVRELDVLARQTLIREGVAHGISFNVGVGLRPTDRLSLGLVYQHGADLRFQGRFSLDMNDDFFTQDLAAEGLRYPPVVEGDARVRMRLPKRVTGAAGYRFHPRFALDGSFSWVFYSDVDRVNIRLRSPDLAQPELGVSDTVDQPLVRDWKGTAHVELAGRIGVHEKLLMSLLLGWHSPATPASTLDMASLDGHRMVFGAGLQWNVREHIALLFDYEGQAIAPRTNTASDFDLGNGEYRLFLSQIGLHGRFAFGGRKDRKRDAPSPEPKPRPAPTEEEATPRERPGPAEPSSPDAGPSAPDRAPPPPPPPPPPEASPAPGAFSSARGSMGRRT